MTRPRRQFPQADLISLDRGALPKVLIADDARGEIR
ncbi:hypothetical protein BZB76_6567 [Actinomadura pelletieri DSM 43383]|uniref:Uncharacterized protein n=1 Tax=Actinomadura pelletieri DSM 43383 TaxID=1120940 RepID=A0A495QA02_9ACTN|nr:hypothetical protein BZB76_6567 [Actinomadura pelletieri DSM 43383]